MDCSDRCCEQIWEFIQTDTVLNDCMRILSLFGMKGRYYNLDVVAGDAHEPIDPESEWKELERRVENPVSYLDDQESLLRDYFPRVNRKLIGRMERLVRAIAMQFTLGGHAGPGSEIRRLSSVYLEFCNLRSDEFGNVDYRRSVEILKRDQDCWNKRSDEEISAEGWPKAILRKAEFDGEWPFRRDRVIVECREKLFYVVNIDGYDFALNGAARSKYRFPGVHEAGIAVIGKSVGPFIQLAAELSSHG